MVKNAVIEVVKGANENNISVMRRFSRRVSATGLVRKTRKARYNERPKSALKRKNEALKRLAKRAVYERLKKLGKVKNAQQNSRN